MRAPRKLSPTLMVMVWLFTPFVPYSGLFGSLRLGLLPVAKNGRTWAFRQCHGDILTKLSRWSGP